jgi:rhodanese-related sulfurtransferase
MNAISTDQLKHMLEAGEQFQLINVLAEERFRRERIPGSISMPVADRHFVRRVKEHVRDNDALIVVYCQDLDCEASAVAASMLQEAGFTRVFDYEVGIGGWKEAELPI